MRGRRTFLISMIIFSVTINLLISYAFRPLVNNDEKNPPEGIQKLSVKSQIMNRLYQNTQIPIVSNIILGIVVMISVLFTLYLTV